MQPNNNSDSNDSRDAQFDGISNPNRRSFLIKGAVAAPILASFINKPVWAIDDSCISSGTLSGNLSNHHCVALARSSGWWYEAVPTLWPTGVGFNRDSSFLSVIGRKPLAFSDNTFHQVKSNGKPFLDGNDNLIFRSLDTSTTTNSLRDILSQGTDFDKQLVASYLNIAHQGIFYSTFDTITTLLNESNQQLANYLSTSKLSISPTNGRISDESQFILNKVINDYAQILALSNTNTDDG